MASRPNSAVRANVLTMFIIHLNTVFVKEFLEIHVKLFEFLVMFHVKRFAYVSDVSRGTFLLISLMFHVEHFAVKLV